MKKVLYILLAASAALFISCEKENVIDTPVVDDPVESSFTGKTITFSASIDMPAATKAALSGLNINWSSGDYIGICTNNDATIVAYPVTVDGSDATQCTITVNEVAGASAYYGILRGSNSNVAADDFSGISFNTTTKTFSGLNVGGHVSQGEFTSHLYYSNGFPLTMAGKADGTSLVMKPCLALVKVQVHSDSVPADHYIVSETYNNPVYNVNHDHSYSAVRGFLFSQRGSSTVYSQGDFTVQVSDNNDLTVTAAGNNVEERELGGENKMVANSPYYMCIIPGGSISSFRFRFWGYADDAGTVSWTPAYVMSLSANVTVSPGSFFDMGTLNPLGRKMAKNHAEDDAADKEAAEAASYTPAIVIDGDFDDWDGITEYDGTCASGSSNSRIAAWRVTSDSRNIYVYMKLVSSKITNSRYIYVALDTDNNDSTGSTYTSIVGCEAYAVYYPAVASSDPVSFIQGADPRSTVNGSSDGSLEIWGVNDGSSLSASTYSYFELCLPRSKVGLNSAATIKIGVSYIDYDAAKQTLVLQ